VVQIIFIHLVLNIIINNVKTHLVLRDVNGVCGVRISLGNEFVLKEVLLDIVALPNFDKFDTPV